MDEGDFDFALAHIALKSDEYKNYFKERAGGDRILFLDNGVWETGTPIDAVTMIELAIETNATYVYAPDYLNDSVTTLGATKGFCEMVKDYPKFTSGILAVAQGEDIREWYHCVEELAAIPEVDVIAIPALVMNDSYEYEEEYGPRLTKTRWEFCKALDMHQDEFNGKKFYATGTGSPICVRNLQDYPWFMGIDTTMACLLGSMEKSILDDVTFKPSEKLDFDIIFTEAQLRYVRQNILTMNKWISGWRYTGEKDDSL